MKSSKVISALLCASVIIGCAGCSTQVKETTGSSEPSMTLSDNVILTNYANDGFLEGYDTFDVTSPDLVDGIWQDVISNTFLGENASPELTWSPVEGAEEYVIYMVDMNSNGYLQWKSGGIHETSLPRGWAPKLLEYNGPHVGHGDTHQYDVFVVALKAPAGRLRGGINGINPQMASFIKGLDIDENGNSGNIIAYGRISGLFTDARYRDI